MKLIKSLLSLSFILYCCSLINAQQVLQHSFSVNSCSYSTEVPTYDINHGSSLIFTTNDGTITLNNSADRLAVWSKYVITATLPLNYQPPVLFTVDGLGTFDVTVPNMACMMKVPLLDHPLIGQYKEISIILNGTVDGELVDIFVDDQKKGTYTIQLVNGAITPFLVYFPYTGNVHTLKVVRLSSGQTLTNSVSYKPNPKITSYNCQRQFGSITSNELPKLLVLCNFVGTGLYDRAVMSGIPVVNSVTTPTSIQTTFTADLPINASISLDTETHFEEWTPTPTGAYFQPHAKTTKNTFTFEKNANNSIVVNIQGSYLDTLSVISTTIKSGGLFYSLDCTYSNESSLANGFVETISCLIPQIKNYDDAIITLFPKYYLTERILLKSDGSFIVDSESSTSSASSSFRPSNSLFLTTLLLVLLSIMYYF